ncbi:unnamed protein product, partial [Effrenium voratum]
MHVAGVLPVGAALESLPSAQAHRVTRPPHRSSSARQLSFWALRASGLSARWPHAVALLETMTRRRVADASGSVWNAVAWALQAGRQQVPPTPHTVAVDLRKEHEVVNFVRRRAKAGDPKAVLRAIEDFARGRKWLKVAGGRKAKLLSQSLRPGDRVVEFGT